MHRFAHHLPALLLAVVALFAGCQESAPVGPGRATLVVNTDPDGAQVLLDDQLVGVTPLERPITPDPHFLEIQLPGHETHWQHIPESVPGDTLGIRHELTPVTAAVIIESTPAGAFVRLDGVDCGQTPAFLPRVGLGEHEVDLTLTGYADKRVIFEIDDARPKRISEDLESVMARLEVWTTPPGAEVFLGDKRQGTTPIGGNNPLVIPDVTAGQYTVTARLRGYEEVSQPVILRRNQARVVRLGPLEELPGAVNITSDPAGASVFNSAGELLGVTPLEVGNLPNGETTFRIAKQGYSDETRTVNIVRGMVKEISVELLTNTGNLSFLTEPPGVKVYVDGKNLGTTRPSDNPAVSRMFEVEALTPGPHVLHLVHPQYEEFRQRFFIERARTARLGTVKLVKRWLPTHELKVTNGTVYRGILITRHADGSILFERAQNIKVTYKKDEIESIRPLTREEKQP